MIIFRRLTLSRIVRLLVTVAAAGCIFLLLGLFRSYSKHSGDDLENLTPLERYFLKSNYTDEILNPHPFEFLIDPGSKVCSDSEIYLLVYVHSAPQHADRRLIIRNTWGNVIQFDLPVKVVFIMGLPVGNASIDEQLASESTEYNDIIQESFIDTYYNITYKAVGALKWVTHNCPQAQFVLKTDDDAFVNMFILLKLLTRMSIVKPSLHERTVMCNLWRDQVPRDGKWKLEKTVFRFDYYPLFCQGLAFILSRDIVAPLYNATYYAPFLQMDDVYLTGFVILRVAGAERIEMNSFYVSDVDILSATQGENSKQYLFSHVKDPLNIRKLWSAAKNVTLALGSIRN